MELLDIIAQLKVSLDESASYHRAGNFVDAHKMLVSIKVYLDEHLPVPKLYVLPNRKASPPTNGISEHPPTSPS